VLPQRPPTWAEVLPLQMKQEHAPLRRGVASVRDRLTVLRQRAERTLLWRVWDRMLEIEFVDRSVALAGKAFVSFFPLVIVIASFAPPRVRTAISSSLTYRLGIAGAPMADVRAAFASADDVRKATGICSFTTALQRVFLRVWRRPAGGKAGEYARGPAWLLIVVACMAVLEELRAVFGDGPQVGLFLVISCAVTAALWWFTAWLMLMGQVRWRVLVPSGVISSILLGGFGL
jgi:membrane protein